MKLIKKALTNGNLKQVASIILLTTWLPGLTLASQPEMLIQGHSASIEAVAFSPDGKSALLGSDDNTLKWWHLETGRVIRTLKAHTQTVTAVAFSPDGKTALSGSDDKTLKLWDLSRGRVIKTLTGHSKSVTAVAFSPNGRYALSGSADKTLKLWNFYWSFPIRTLKAHTQTVTAVAFSPNGKTALSGSDDKTLKRWDLSRGRVIRTLKGHTDSVWAVAISPDGKTALSGSWDGTLKWWNLSRGYVALTYKERHSSPVLTVAFSPDGKKALLGSDDKALTLLNLSRKRLIREYQGHSDSVLAVAFSPDGKTALSGSRDTTTRLWNLQTGDEIVRMTAFNNGEWITITPEGYYQASTNGAEYLKVYTKGISITSHRHHKSTYHRPDIVKLALKLSDSQQAITQANKPQANQKPPIPTARPPKKRLALVIGNSAYKDNAFLSNPVNDAEDLANVLRQLDFEVIHKKNLNQQQMETTINQFGNQLRTNNGIGLFYFSGHGIQHNGENYLIPIGATNSLKSAAQLRYKAVAAGYVLETMKAAGNEVNLLILDACRNTPFKSWFKGEMISPGLTPMPTAPGALIAYAASPGGVAMNGKGRNSPYVKHLMKWIQVPDLSINEVLRRVRWDVRKETHRMQSPGYYDELNEEFYFKRR
jgi:WD40 repeat protein